MWKQYIKQALYQIIKTLLPFFAAIAVVLLLVTYVPAMSMWIPSMLGLVK